MQEALKILERGGLKGSFVVRSHKPGEIKWGRKNGRVVADISSLKAAMRAPLYQHPRQHNLVVSSDGYGRNLLLRAMSGDSTYPIVIDSGAIGTGATAPVDGNTGLQTSVLAGIPVALFELADDVLIVSFFIPDDDLANDSYDEFGMFMGGRLFARAILSPDYDKGTGIDTTIEYTLTFST